MEIEAENQAVGTPFGYGFEEHAEIYLIKGETVLAKQYFAKAYELLVQDEGLVSDKPGRLERMRRLAR